MYIEVENLTKVISKNTVLSNINIKMEQGKIYGLKGKNGSGKTMLMRAICGLMIPTEGKVIIDGKVLGKELSFPESIGALIESPGFISNYSGYKNLKILADIQGKISEEKIKQTISLVGLDPEDKKKFKKYSLGMKQKLGIAAAIMEDAKIIVLDEPTNALDENSIKNLSEILRDLRDKGALIIISCHDSEELSYLSDEIFFIENGEMKKYIKVKEEVKLNETEK
ncbi:multidrug ABC transporter ATP-binding protein [Clostridium sulfidigenes]|uniref:Multidrug ABC transporter ATP-binding protein n=1 Tax=Clostridium sulfidigenes TaxID=318464 RepID=A0A084JEV5_9CLOT|nr:ATP-binding cassette domain-containing protein [Clostridium sulfidigenes]KEZ87489.1 multidrug ABC transporter ATP-binding protein [Clostridium sulfidigenes]